MTDKSILQLLVNRTGTPEWVTVLVHAPVGPKGVYGELYLHHGEFFDTTDGTKIALAHAVEARLVYAQPDGLLRP